MARHLRAGGWRRPHVWAAVARLALRTRNLKFAARLALFRAPSQRAQLRALAWDASADILHGCGLLRRAEPDPRPVAAKTAGDYGEAYWEQIFESADPWNYNRGYEQTKYQQTLDLLPEGRIGRALELACAEGHFTQMLAPRVEDLVATDISEIALGRVAQACSGHGNIRFALLDFRNDEIEGTFDLIVCSEVLYYIEDRRLLRDIARRLRAHLAPGGRILMAHALVANDDPGSSGFNWGHRRDVRTIGAVFGGTRGLRLAREARSDLYRIQLFEAVPETGRARMPPPEILRVTRSDDISFHKALSVSWNGALHCQRTEVTDRLPILMYHRVAPDGIAALDAYRVTPGQFAAQMRYLAENGYYATTLDAWQTCKARFRGMPGRAGPSQSPLTTDIWISANMPGRSCRNTALWPRFLSPPTMLAAGPNGTRATARWRR